jgi:phage terminase large subunit-like protein
MTLPEGFNTWPESEQDLYVMRAKWMALTYGKGRMNQLPPPGAWRIWLLLAGRGFGKTRVAAEDVGYDALGHKKWRIAVIAPTNSDVRKTCFEGESGLCAVIPEKYITKYNRSTAEMFLSNGTELQGFSAEEPNRIRGPQFHKTWVDEWAAIEDALSAERAAEMWANIEMATRLKPDPRIIITTTPKPFKILRGLKLEAESGKGRVVMTEGSTLDNRDNLAEAAVKSILGQYEGSRRGQQEIYGKLLDEIQGALWTTETIDKHRVAADKVPQLRRIVVAVDPMTGQAPEDPNTNAPGSETGIIVAGIGYDGHVYILADRSLPASPDTWGRIALQARDEFAADKVIAEVNNGGVLVEHVLRTIDPNVAYEAVTASRGKLTRAEPVAALYEQGKVHHAGLFVRLEDQLVTYSGGANEKSPDRLDALVWAVTKLALGAKPIPMVGAIGVESPNYWKGV